MANNETCENCGRMIGSLETAHVHAGHVVCALCAAKLAPVPIAPIAYAPPEPRPVSVNGVGVAGTVVGILAILFVWIPFCGIGAIPLAVIGLLLGIIGTVMAVTSRRTTLTFPVAAGIVSGLALAIGILNAVATGKTIDEVSKNMAAASKQGTASIAGNAPSPKITWASAALPVKQGDVEVQVVSARISKVKLKSMGDETTSKDHLLVIDVRVKNLHAAKKIDYRTWASTGFDLGDHVAAASDDAGNHYKRINFGFGAEVIGAVRADSVYPGKTVSDVLVFEVPVDAAKEVRLELPGGNVGADDPFRFSIRSASIQRE